MVQNLPVRDSRLDCSSPFSVSHAPRRVQVELVPKPLGVLISISPGHREADPSPA